MGIRYIQSNYIFINNKFIGGVLEMDNGIINNIYPLHFHNDDVEDYSDYYIIPGLVDIHTHGYAGWPFSGTSTVEDLLLLSKKMASFGLTSMMCSATKSGYDTIVNAITNYQEALATKFLGIHTEGPFLTITGAAKPGTVFPEPSIALAKDIMDKTKGYLKYVTIAIDKENVDPVIDFYTKNNVKVAIGHTDATAEEFNAKKDKCQSVTHTGNAMRGIHHRDIGTLGAALLDSNIYCEIIADGIHISADMLRLIFKVKPHNKLILVSDTTALAGLHPGTYELMDYTVEVAESGLIINEFGHINGSNKSVLECIRYLHFELQIPLETILPMATINPAKLLELDQQKGKIVTGFDADVVILNAGLEVIETIVEGKTVYKKGDEVVAQNKNLDAVIKDPEFMSFYD